MVGSEGGAWARHALRRERSQARLLVLLATVLVPAWIPFDYVLEPRTAPMFAALRCVDAAVGLALLAALRRARTLRGVRALACTKIIATGWTIALMLPLVTEHYWLYLLGFSLLFWGAAVILSLPWQTVGSAFAVVVAGAAASPSCSFRAWPTSKHRRDRSMQSVTSRSRSIWTSSFA